VPCGPGTQIKATTGVHTEHSAAQKVLCCHLDETRGGVLKYKRYSAASNGHAALQICMESEITLADKGER